MRLVSLKHNISYGDKIPYTALVSIETSKKVSIPQSGGYANESTTITSRRGFANDQTQANRSIIPTGYKDAAQ